jgi:formate hydrogenlyase subunit 6/NADH:ubiquinone oxidoreductase subunit I
MKQEINILKKLYKDIAINIDTYDCEFYDYCDDVCNINCIYMIETFKFHEQCEFSLFCFKKCNKRCLNKIKNFKFKEDKKTRV